jgi:hypothetical protein
VVHDGGGERFVPDGLELTIVKSDPPSYRLYCEAWKKFNGSGSATLSAEDFMSAKKTSVALAVQVGGLSLDRWPGEWSRIWDGSAGRPKTAKSEGVAPVVGLRTILLEEAVAAGRIEEVHDPARHRLRRLALLLVSAISRRVGSQGVDNRTEEDEYPLSVNAAQWISSSEEENAPMVLWFGWQAIWAEVEKAYRVEPNEGARLIAAMPEIIGRKLTARKKQINGQRASFRTMSQEEWNRLEAFAIGDCEAAASIGQLDLKVKPASVEGRNDGTLVCGDSGEVVGL